jgi:microcin C transport system substrate-binding protein
LGITLDYRWREPTSATKMLLDHEFDMASFTQWSPKLLPGASERLLWGSKYADRKGSYAMSGAKDAALDKAIAAMNSAQTMKDLETATRTFDRILRWRRYMVPMWRADDIWVAWRKGLGQPEKRGRYSRSFIDLWWKKPNDTALN